MHNLPVLLTVASLWSVAAVTPGPNSLAVMRVAVVGTRAHGLRTVAGIAVGTCLWGLSGFFGVHALFVAAPFLYEAFRVCGGAYLIVFGLRLLWRSFRTVEGEAPEMGGVGRGPFRLGLATSLSNPKTALSVASLFAATLPSQAPIDLGLLTVGLMVSISVAWYSLVVWLLTARWMTVAQRTLRRVMDRIAGAIFVVFGARLVLQR
jgi:threonine/homoserine/homoserine lactone efflux protein